MDPYNKPFPGRVPADAALRAKKTKDTRKLQWQREQDRAHAWRNESVKNDRRVKA